MEEGGTKNNFGWKTIFEVASFFRSSSFLSHLHLRSSSFFRDFGIEFYLYSYVMKFLYHLSENEIPATLCQNEIPMRVPQNEIPTSVCWIEIPMTNHLLEVYTIYNPAGIPSTSSLSLL